MKLRECIQYGQQTLKEAGIDTYDSDVRVLAMYAFDLSYTDLLMNMSADMPENKTLRFKECIIQRSRRYPCQYITGSQEFMGYKFYTSEGVLIPRPETELLVEKTLAVSEDMPDVSLLDVCCGSGCIGISYALERRAKGKSCKVTLLDISDDAIALSKKNSRLNDIDCDIVQSDLFENIEEKYGIIVSNPPYIKSEDILTLMDDVRMYEPVLALDGGEDGLIFYKKIITKAGDYLDYGGYLLFEIGYNQFEDIRGLLVDAGYSDIELTKDYAGLDRIISARLI